MLQAQPWCAAVQETPGCEDCRCDSIHADLACLQGFSAPGVLRTEAQGLAWQLSQAPCVDRLHVLAVRVQLHAPHTACRHPPKLQTVTQLHIIAVRVQLRALLPGLTACRHLTQLAGTSVASRE